MLVGSVKSGHSVAMCLSLSIESLSQCDLNHLGNEASLVDQKHKCQVV